MSVKKTFSQKYVDILQLEKLKVYIIRLVMALFQFQSPGIERAGSQSHCHD